ncbi:MAG: hypothetical protein ACOWWM_18445 [Desulfobacterales bacterium]
MIEIRLKRQEAVLLHDALMAWDGPTLQPEWGQDRQEALTAALDRLRLVVALRTENVSPIKGGSHE